MPRKFMQLELIEVGRCWIGRWHGIRGRVVEISDNHGARIVSKNGQIDLREHNPQVSVKIVKAGDRAMAAGVRGRERDVTLKSLSYNYTPIIPPTMLELYKINMSRLDRGQGEMMHCPLPVTIDGRGPANDHSFHHWACWCPDGERCKVIFNLAWKALVEVTRG